MQYRKDRYGNDLSVLAYGCMRFTRGVGGIDIKKAEQEVMEAYRLGVNYFDTAYIYPGSEAALGEIVEANGIRGDIHIATKLPHYLIKNRDGMDRLFSEQLRRLRTGYVDYYLMHMLTDVTAWERLVRLGIKDWLEEKKASGAIRQIGFSYHGNADAFCALLDAYDWDFAMIQYNYLDEHSQAGVTGLRYAAAKGLPVMVMEPLRGGKLAGGLPKEAQRLFAAHEPKRSPAEWAFRWLWNQPEVSAVLSGMNSLEMIRENARAASDTEAGAFTAAEEELFARVVKAVNAKMKVPCTGCRYCMPCPKMVDIPGAFAAYNRTAADGYFSGLRDYFMCTGLRGDYTGVANCIGCGKCEQHCPQGIAIRKELKKVQKSLETPLYQAGRKVFPLFMKYRD